MRGRLGAGNGGADNGKRARVECGAGSRGKREYGGVDSWARCRLGAVMLGSAVGPDRVT